MKAVAGWVPGLKCFKCKEEIMFEDEVEYVNSRYETIYVKHKYC